MSSSYSVCPRCLKVNKVNLATASMKAPACGACGTSLDFDHGVTNLSGAQVQKLIEKSPLPVVIDFWAPWCGPCRSFAPTFSATAEDLQGQYVFVKVNTEQDPQAGVRFGVRGIPTIAVFHQGKELDRQAGALPAEHFKHWLRQNRS